MSKVHEAHVAEAALENEERKKDWKAEFEIPPTVNAEDQRKALFARCKSYANLAPISEKARIQSLNCLRMLKLAGANAPTSISCCTGGLVLDFGSFSYWCDDSGSGVRFTEERYLPGTGQIERGRDVGRGQNSIMAQLFVYDHAPPKTKPVDEAAENAEPEGMKSDEPESPRDQDWEAWLVERDDNGRPMWLRDFSGVRWTHSALDALHFARYGDAARTADRYGGRATSHLFSPATPSAKEARV